MKILTNSDMRGLYVGVLMGMMVLAATVTYAQPRYTVTTNIGAAQESWNSAAAWSIPAGFTPFEGFPRNDFDEDNNTTVPLATADHGAYIVIDVNDKIIIPNNTTIDLRNSRLIRITIKSGAELHFASNSKLQLPSGCEIVFESGAEMIADNNSNGTYLEIGGNGVWGRQCDNNGCDNSTQTGPGVINENSTPGGNLLPVELLYFHAITSNETVRMDWATASETNSTHFRIERSSNGVDFDELGQVPAAGNSHIKVTYSFVDDKPIIGRTYYRLVQVDIDGQSETFPSVIANISGNKALSIFPVPSRPSEDVSISLNFSNESISHAMLIDNSGQVVKQFSFTGTTYKFEDKPGKGIYIVKVTNSGNTYNARLIVL
jgi:hypothetical protein